MTRHPIIVGYDGSQSSREALLWALADGRTRGLDVEVVHALTPPMAVMPSYGAVAEPDPATHRRFAEQVLREAEDLAAETAPDVTVRTRLLNGYPATSLLSTLENADRVVLGSRGLGTFAELLLGSVSLEITSRAPCPVVVIRQGTHADATSEGDGGEAGRVVVGVDGSPASEQALAVAFEEASLRGVGLTAVLAWAQPFYDLPGHGGPIPESVQVEVFDGEEMRWLSEALAGWREKFPDVELRQVVRHGSPAEVLSAMSAGAELLVVGSRGRGGFRTLLLGSVSHAALHHAHCPVMVVRPQHD